MLGEETYKRITVHDLQLGTILDSGYLLVRKYYLGYDDWVKLSFLQMNGTTIDICKKRSDVVLV